MRGTRRYLERDEYREWHGLGKMVDYSTQDADVTSQRPFLLPRVMQSLQKGNSSNNNSSSASTITSSGGGGGGSGSGGSTSAEAVDWRQERFISHASCKWPFRVRVDALQLTSQFLKNQICGQVQQACVRVTAGVRVTARVPA